MRKIVLAVLALASVPGAALATAYARAEPEEPGVIALRAPPPAWFTAGAAERLAEPGSTEPAPLDAPLPGEAGIRPGSWMISPYHCTMNFVFTNGVDLAIGTAGHCTDRLGQPITLLTLAPGGPDPVLVTIGKVLMRANAGVGRDFALISIDPSLRSWVTATIAGVGGPCRRFGGTSQQLLAYYGHGLGIGTGGTPRAGVSTVWSAGWYEWSGPVNFGDSGGAVRVNDMRAAGNLTHVGVIVPDLVPAPVGYGTRIGKILSYAKGWSLVDSPLCTLS